MFKDAFAENFPTPALPRRSPGSAVRCNFTDSSYLSAVISHLRDERLAKDIGVAPLTRRAELR